MAAVLLELQVLIADLRLALAQRRVQRSLDDMVRKYRPDQPRAPRARRRVGSGSSTRAWHVAFRMEAARQNPNVCL